MELKVFTKVLHRGCKSHVATISIGKQGVLMFNRPCAELMKIDLKNRLFFCQNPQELKDWYIVVNPDLEIEAIPIRKPSAPSGAFCLSHAALRDEIVSSCNLPADTTYKMLVGEKCEMTILGEPVIAYPIITKSAK